MKQFVSSLDQFHYALVHELKCDMQQLMKFQSMYWFRSIQICLYQKSVFQFDHPFLLRIVFLNIHVANHHL